MDDGQTMLVTWEGLHDRIVLQLDRSAGVQQGAKPLHGNPNRQY
jgi:hypothetical protein